MSLAARYGPWGPIVGASQGIGASSARQLAEHGLDLVLVALPEDPLDDVVAEVLLAQVRVNCDAAVSLTRRLLPPMVDRGRGGLVLTSSMSSLVASPWIATYAATKAFLLRFGESLAEELRGTGVDVTVLVPGAVDTPKSRWPRTASSTPGTWPPRSVPTTTSTTSSWPIWQRGSTAWRRCTG